MLKLILLFIMAIALMIAAISKWKVHPFVAIFSVAILLAVATGIPSEDIPTIIGKGFSSVLESIGLVIIFGMLIGTVLERTGAAFRLAGQVLKMVGDRHPRLAMMIIGWIVSVPVFCDSGYVILNPIRKNIARKTGTSPVSLALALSVGLYTSHVFIPPTPGPVAAAGMLGIDNHLLLVTGIGIIVSIFALIPSFFFAGYAGRKIKSTEEEPTETPSFENETMPSTWASLLPILVPILLMAARSLGLVPMLGKPVTALFVGFLCCLWPLHQTGKLSQFSAICQDALKDAGPIIFITAAGGILGRVISETSFVQYVQSSFQTVTGFGLLLPFIIAVIIKSSVGSSTVAITTTASLMGMFSDSGSLLSTLGYTSGAGAALAVLAIGAGAMVVSHANDSYFWVVTGFSGISPENGYRTHSLMTLIAGLGAMAGILIVQFFIL